MMHVVKVGTGPVWEEVVQTPWHLVARMCVNSLEQSEHDPRIHGEDMKVASDRTIQKRRAYCTGAEQHDFDWRSILCGHAKWCRILVMDLVDILVHWTPVQETVVPVMPGIFKDEEDQYLADHLPYRWERYGRREAAEVCHRMEEPYLRKLDGEVAE